MPLPLPYVWRRKNRTEDSDSSSGIEENKQFEGYLQSVRRRDTMYLQSSKQLHSLCVRVLRERENKRGAVFRISAW